MAPRYQELIPARSSLPTRREDDAADWALIPDQRLDGWFSSMMTRARADRRSRTLQALTTEMESAQEYFDARREALEACIKAQEASYQLQELPYKAAEATERQRQARAEERREEQHRSELADLRRARERVEAEAALRSAEQKLDADRGIGRQIEWNRRNVELLDIELAGAERRAILRQHLAELQQANKAGPVPTNAIENALYEARALLNAHGADTSTIDAILERRRP